MTTITKEQIERLKYLATTMSRLFDGDDVNEVVAICDCLLNQPEPEPVAKLVLEDVCDFGDAKRLSISWLMEGYPPVGSFLYTHPPAPKAITAEDVTDEMVFSLWNTRVITSTGLAGKRLVAAAVNAFNGVKV